MSLANSDKLLELLDVSKSYMIGNREMEILKNISFSVEKNDFICIMGPSGSGKTTLLEIMATIRKPMNGRIFFEDEDITDYTNEDLSQIRLEIGYMSQNLTLEPFLTIWENLKLSNKSLNFEHESVKKLVRDFNLERYLNRYPAQLSGGEYRKVMLVAALVKNPKVIIADEPTANIDLSSAQTIMELVKSAHENGIPVIYSTHSRELAKYAKKVYKLSKGRLTKMT